MALRLVADAPTDLPEGLRAHAKTSADGKVMVEALPEGWEIGDTVGLRKFLGEERTARKEAEKALKAYEGIDDAEAAREAYTQMRAGKLKSSAELDEFRKQLEAKVGADLAKKDHLAKSLTKQLTEQMVEATAMKALADVKGNARLLMPIIKAAVKAEITDDGRLSVAMVDDAGKELVSKVAGATGSMGIAEFVSTLRAQPEYAGAFAGSGTGGSGATQTSTGVTRAAPAGLPTPRELLNRANGIG
jgi:hypothetical protein